MLNSVFQTRVAQSHPPCICCNGTRSIAVSAALSLSLLTSTALGAEVEVCPPGSINTTPDPSGTSYSTLFDIFVVAAGDAGTCQLHVPTSLPDGVIGVYSADYRGAVTVADGEAARLTVTQLGRSDGTTFSGPLDVGGDLLYSNLVGSRDGSLNSDIRLDLTQASDLFSFAALDSVDYFELARTTFDSVQESIDQLAAGRTAIVTRLNTISGLLTGSLDPLEEQNEIALRGSAGSYMFGATGRYNLGNGFSVLGGGAVTEVSGGDASASGVLLSGALRYLQPGHDKVRYFGELGAVGAPSLDMRFRRDYEDGSPGGASIIQDLSGSFFAAYLKGGMLYAPNPNNRVLFSGTLMGDWLGNHGYEETLEQANLFAASVDDQTNSFTTLKLGAAFTHYFTSQLDVTLTGALGKTFSMEEVASNVAFIGSVAGRSQDEEFAELGARIGYELSRTTKADAFVLTSIGNASGQHVEVGAAFHFKF